VHNTDTATYKKTYTPSGFYILKVDLTAVFIKSLFKHFLSVYTVHVQLSKKLTAVSLYNEPKTQLLIKIFQYLKWILH